MRSRARWFVVPLVLILSGHTSSFECLTPPRGWFVKICRARTEVDRIRLYVGIGGLASSHGLWRTWTPRDPDVLLVPTQFRYAKELWIQGIGDPRGRNGSLCVGFNDTITEDMQFDGPDGDQDETSRDDGRNDDCECP